MTEDLEAGTLKNRLPSILWALAMAVIFAAAVYLSES